MIKKKSNDSEQKYGAGVVRKPIFPRPEIILPLRNQQIKNANNLNTDGNIENDSKEGNDK